MEACLGPVVDAVLARLSIVARVFLLSFLHNMAHIIHASPQFGFPSIPTKHGPPALAFGFGMSAQSSMAGWHGTIGTPGLGQTNFHLSTAPPSAQQTPRAAQKRRHDEEEEGLRDHSMDRSPTPERRPMKRIAPKRMRSSSEEDAHIADKENKKPSKSVDDDVDVGMLLGAWSGHALQASTYAAYSFIASLPQESLLPLLTSLLTTQPSLKATILSLIPRPTIDTAVTVLAQSAKKLRDAYPYSTTPSFSQTAVSFGFGSASGSNQRSVMSQPNSGFGRNPPHTGLLPTTSGMRDSYVLSRLRPHVTDFVSTAFSYLSYFTCAPSASTQPNPHVAKDTRSLPNPTDTFTYLSAVTFHLTSQPPLAQSLLAPLLLQRILQEWMAWVDRVVVYVNNEGGMFGIDVVGRWSQTLDEQAEARISGVSGDLDSGLRTVRDKWVARVGWLVGRREVLPMEEEEEL